MQSLRAFHLPEKRYTGQIERTSTDRKEQKFCLKGTTNVFHSVNGLNGQPSRWVGTCFACYGPCDLLRSL